METGPFYSMFAVGEYTFSPWKVVWTRVGSDIRAGVVGSVVFDGTRKPIIPIETATLIALDDHLEAHFVCAYVNSSIFRMAVVSHSVHGTGGFGSPHILTHVCVPTYIAAESTHARLAQLSESAHALAPQAYAGNPDAQRDLAAVEDEVDRAAATLWGLTDEELEDVRASLRELKG